MKSTKDIVLENILRKMSEQRLSQVQLAKLSTIDTVLLNKMLNKKRGIGQKSLERLAKALMCDIGDLYSDHDAQKVAAAIPEAPTRSDLVFRLINALPTVDIDDLKTIAGMAVASAARAAARSKAK